MMISRLLLAIVLSTLVGLAAVWPMALLVDTVLMPGAQPWSLLSWLPQEVQQNPVMQIAVLAVMALLLRLAQELLGAWRELLNTRIGHARVLRLRSELFNRLQELGLLFHRAQPQGDTLLRLTRDAAGCHQVLCVVIEVVVAAMTLAVILTVMFQRSAALTLVALGVIPLLLIANVMFGKALQFRSRLARSAESEFTTTTCRTISTIPLTQAFGRQRDELHRFDGSSRASMGTAFDLQHRFTLYRITVGLIFGTGTAIIFGWGGAMVWQDQIQGHNPAGMTAGSLVVFIAYLGMLYDPLCRLSGAGANMLDGVTGMERVHELLDREPAVRDAVDASPLAVQPRAVTFTNVSFAYDDAKPALGKINLRIAAGEMIAFVGGSGAGKSTLLNLLCRFFDPSSGCVSLDGCDYREIRLEDLRRHVAVVFQDNLIMPTTIGDNIAYGRPEADTQDIRLAAKMAGIADFIESLPLGYDTPLAEGGHNLSGGQRQRIAIARALLTRAPILVLDEPTSALDPHCEQQIIDTLAAIKGQRTIILVSHRMSTVLDCDRICVMHEGRIIAAADHASHMQQRGWYANTVHRQLPHVVSPLLTAEPVLN